MNQAKLSVKVIPSSSKGCIVGWLGDSLKIKVQAPPEKGKANRSVIKILAKELGISPKSISIVSGGVTSTNKVFIIPATIDFSKLRHAFKAFQSSCTLMRMMAGISSGYSVL